MNDVTDLSNTIKPKSDQLNADDLLTGPITVKITDVRAGNVEQPVHIYIEGQQPYKPCKGMRRVLIRAWGSNGKEWIGKSLTLFCNPNVKWAGVALGGIQISHLSHIEGVLSIMLTQARGRKSEFRVSPLIVESQSFVVDDNVKDWISAAKADMKALDQITDPEYRKFIESQL